MPPPPAPTDACRPYYDLATLLPSEWTALSIALLYAVIIYIGFVYFRAIGRDLGVRSRRRAVAAVALIMGAFAAFAVADALEKHRETRALVAAMRGADLLVVTGAVTNHRSARAGARGEDKAFARFSVAGVDFTYTEHFPDALRVPYLGGSRLREGLRVRIGYIERGGINVFTRIDICEPGKAGR